MDLARYVARRTDAGAATEAMGAAAAALRTRRCDAERVRLMPPAVVPEHLVFRSSNGSLALAGVWMVVIGSLVVLASLGNLLIRGPGAPRPVRHCLLYTSDAADE